MSHVRDKKPFHLTGGDAKGRPVDKRFVTAEEALAAARKLRFSTLPLPYVVTYEAVEAALRKSEQ